MIDHLITAWELRQLRTRSHNISDQIGLCAQLGIGGASADNIISAKMRASCDLIVRDVGAGNCRSGPTSTSGTERTIYEPLTKGGLSDISQVAGEPIALTSRVCRSNWEIENAIAVRRRDRKSVG